MENGALEKLNDAIDNAEKDINIENNNIKREEISHLLFDFMKQKFPKNINSTDLINTTNEIIENHPELVFRIINSFTQSCILKERELEDIGKGISEIISDNREPEYGSISNSKKTNESFADKLLEQRHKQQGDRSR